MTITAELSPNPTKDGRYKLYIRITQDRKIKRLTTSYLIHKKDFNKNAVYGKWIRTSDHRQAIINDLIKKKFDQMNKALNKLEQDGKEITAKSILESYKNLFVVKEETQPLKNDQSFVGFIERVIKRYHDLDQTRTAVRLNGVLSKFKSFLGDKSLDISEFNLEVLKDFQAYLSSVKKNSTNTISKDLKSFRQAFKREILENPNLKYDLRLDLMKFKSERSNKEKLTKEEIDLIKKADLKIGSFLWHARNYYLFSYYEAGIRFGDVCELEWNNIISNSTLSYKMSKVNKLHSVTLRDEAKQIVKPYLKRKGKFKYIFPLLPQNFNELDPQLQVRKRDSLNTQCNKAIKEIAKLVGIDKKLTFHTSRHTFAYMTYKETKDVRLVQSLLNHSSLHETESYLKELTIDEKGEGLKNISL